MKRLWFWFSGWRPCRIIARAEAPYLERYFLCRFGSVHVYLHRFVGSDPNRMLHDHPWGLGGSLVLSGSYYEELPAGGRVRMAGDYAAMNGEHLHQVWIPEGQECWTLFWHGRRTKGWGLFRPVTRHPEAISRNGRRYRYLPIALSAADEEHPEWWRQAPLGRNIPSNLRAPPRRRKWTRDDWLLDVVAPMTQWAMAPFVAVALMLFLAADKADRARRGVLLALSRMRVGGES